MKKHLLIFVTIMLICSGFDRINSCHPFPLKNPEIDASLQIAVWSEFLEDQALLQTIPLLAHYQTTLNLHIPQSRIGEDALASLIHAFSHAGIEIRAWLTLPYEQGYWPNEVNRHQFALMVHDFVNWAQQEQLSVKWIIFDMEIDYAQTKALLDLSDALSNGDFTAAKKLYQQLEANYNPEQFLEAAKDYRDLVDFLHQNQFLAQVTTYPIILDDMMDHDSDLQDITNTPVWVAQMPIQWDLYSFMVYRTVYGEDRFSADLIYSYSQSIQRLLGEKGAIDLGIIGWDELTQSGYSSLDAMRPDYEAALAAGLNRIHLYSLEGTLQNSPQCLKLECLWLDSSWITPKRPRRQPLVAQMRQSLRRADRWLFRNPVRD